MKKRFSKVLFTLSFLAISSSMFAYVFKVDCGDGRGTYFNSMSNDLIESWEMYLEVHDAICN